MKYVLLLVLLIFAMMGLAEFMHGLKLKLHVPKGRAATYSVLVLGGACPEQQIAYAAEQQRWLGHAYADRVVALDDALTGEQRSRCSAIAEREQVVLCGKKDWEQFLLSRSNEIR